MIEKLLDTLIDSVIRNEINWNEFKTKFSEIYHDNKNEQTLTKMTSQLSNYYAEIDDLIEYTEVEQEAERIEHGLYSYSEAIDVLKKLKQSLDTLKLSSPIKKSELKD